MSNAIKRVGAWCRGPVPISVLLAFVIGALFMLLAGVDPVSGYSAIVKGSFGSGMGFSDTIERAIPIIGIGIAIAVAFRAGVFNLGTEGQAGLGALVGGLVAVYLPGPGLLVLPLAILAAVAAGAFWGLLSALLQNFLGVPILLSTLLLNYPVRFFASWLIRFKLDDQGSDLLATPQMPLDHQVGMLVPASSPAAESLRSTFGAQSPITQLLVGVNWSLVILLVVVAGIMFLNHRTAYGFESGLSGQNAEFVRYGGVKPGPLVARTMLLSGGLAGLFGCLVTIGAPNTRVVEGAFIQTNYAWTALLVTLLALSRPVGVVIAGVFFAAIMVGSAALGRELSLSPQIAAIIQAIVIILLAFRVTLPRFRKKRTRQHVNVADSDSREGAL